MRSDVVLVITIRKMRLGALYKYGEYLPGTPESRRYKAVAMRLVLHEGFNTVRPMEAAKRELGGTIKNHVRRRRTIADSIPLIQLIQTGVNHIVKELLEPELTFRR